MIQIDKPAISAGLATLVVILVIYAAIWFTIGMMVERWLT